MGRPSRTLVIVLNLLLFFAPAAGFGGTGGSSLILKFALLAMMLVVTLAPATTILYLHRHVARRKVSGALRPILVAANGVTLFFFLATMIVNALTSEWEEPPGVFFVIAYMILPIANIMAVSFLRRESGQKGARP